MIAAAPRLRLIHLIGAGIEGAMPLDWLPPGAALTNNSGVHAAKIGEFFLMALVALNSRLPAMVTNQRAALYSPCACPDTRKVSTTNKREALTRGCRAPR